MCQMCIADQLHDSNTLQDGESSAAAASSSAPWNVDQIANYLTDGYWNAQGWSSFKFNVAPGGTLTYSVVGLSADERFFIEAALESWTNATGINFVQTSSASSADIKFQNTAQDGAWCSSSYRGGFIEQSTVNIPTYWFQGDEGDLNSYSLQTYIHEIGHALGLGHAGLYNGSATYGQDNLYANDSWQMSVMSYFSQNENTSVDATYAYVVSPMMADVLAVHNLYGTPTTVQTGDTVYGYNSTAGGYLDDLAGLAGEGVAFTVVDSSGTDTLDFSGESGDQVINLMAEVASDVMGETGNLFIARGTEIENANGGSGDDTLNGNDLANVLDGGDGDDTVNGGSGDDTLRGGKGADKIYGEDGHDVISGGGGNWRDLLYGEDGNDRVFGYNGSDILYGGEGHDSLYGGNGNDRMLGSSGEDKLYGQGSQDILEGGAGRDILNGGSSDDSLTGGSGNDMFIFTRGNDVITDFNQADNDKLRLDDWNWGEVTLTRAQIIDQFASVIGGDTVFDFGNGHTVTLLGYTDLVALEADILFF